MERSWVQLWASSLPGNDYERVAHTYVPLSSSSMTELSHIHQDCARHSEKSAKAQILTDRQTDLTSRRHIMATVAEGRPWSQSVCRSLAEYHQL